jgi:histidyl-tRNA synthetase
MSRFRAVETAFRDTCLKWRYQEIRTPTIEYLHLFTSTGTLTPSTLSKVYSFLDWDGWSGERVVLRPDGTIPVARLYIDNMAQAGLARLFYVTNIFIFEETGKETREKWQCGAELIGAGSTAADVEIITMAVETLSSLGLGNVTLKLSHAGLIRALLAGFGLSAEDQSKAFDEILDGDVAVLARVPHQRPELVRLLTPLLDLRGESSGFLKNVKAAFNQNLPGFGPALDNFIGVADTLTALGQPYQIDIGSGRGFEYYTGTIFQLLAGDLKVGGGGRYDALIPLLGGENTPACGFALYVDPIMGLLGRPADARRDVAVEPGDDAPTTVKAAFQLAARLREEGFSASLGGRSPAAYRIEVRAAAPRFTVTGRSTRGKQEMDSVEDVLKAIGASRAR